MAAPLPSMGRAGLLLAALLASCGGGSSTSSTSPPGRRLDPSVATGDADTFAVSVAGTVTTAQDPTTQELDVTFSITLLNADDSTQSTLSGNGTPPDADSIEFLED